ncbi:MAG: homoserine dehydrogenase [Bacillota bacterium]|jgi:homoserine dehydrogenase
MKKQFGVGIMGLGTVGLGTATILMKNKETLTGRRDGEIKVVSVLEKRVDQAKKDLEKIGIDPAIVTDDFERFMAADGLDIVVELIGGVTVAKEYILKALNSGKSVVTANKDLMAIHGKELLDAAEQNKVDLRFEASVAGGIPIINVMKHDLVANEIECFMGIMNGTTNYILTRMYEENGDFNDILKEAQALGYAEADPTADIGGFDAARKVAILASIAYNSRVTLDDVFVEGIEKIDARDIAAADNMGYVIKLLGIAQEVDGEIEARVHPMMIPKKHPLAAVGDTFNAVFVHGNAVGETMFYGRGAGDLPTGSAVVADICAVVSHMKNGVLGIEGCTCYLNKPIRAQENFISKFYLRMCVKDSPGVLALIAKIFGDYGVSIASVIQEKGDHQQAELFIITHSVREGEFMKAKEVLMNTDAVYGIENIIRVEKD